MTFFDTFAGIGGFTIPLLEAGWECMGYSEINSYASMIYQKHFPTHRNYGDITTIVPAELPDFDLLTGGFPCQSFSMAGKRRGFQDTRGTLFFFLADILRVKQPRYLFFENVKGLLSHDAGDTFATIIRALDDVGYDCQWQVLNSKHFGVAQSRERVFIVGHHRDLPRSQVFPLRASTQGDTQTQAASQSQRQRLWSDDTSAEEEPLIELREDGLANCLTSCENRSNLIATSLCVDGITGSTTPTKVRRLTPLECERLQGFPDGWTEGISDSQRYKCLGNAVTVNVIRAIIDRFLVSPDD